MEKQNALCYAQVSWRTGFYRTYLGDLSKLHSLEKQIRHPPFNRKALLQRFWLNLAEINRSVFNVFISCLQTYLKEKGQDPHVGVSCMRENSGKCPKSFKRAVTQSKGNEIRRLGKGFLVNCNVPKIRSTFRGVELKRHDHDARHGTTWPKSVLIMYRPYIWNTVSCISYFHCNSNAWVFKLCE